MQKIIPVTFLPAILIPIVPIILAIQDYEPIHSISLIDLENWEINEAVHIKNRVNFCLGGDQRLTTDMI